jgi:uncharacterized membrane protein
MSPDDEVNKQIQRYIENIRRRMPDTFETDDILQDLRIHILDALKDKAGKQPSADRIVLVQEIIDDLGSPEEIAEEYSKASAPDVDDEKQRSTIIITAVRYSITAVVVIAAAWFVSTIPDSIVDFWTALIILIIFVSAETVLRTWQKSESSKIEAQSKV